MADTTSGFGKVGRAVTGPINAAVGGAKSLAAPKGVKAAKVKIAVKVKKGK